MDELRTIPARAAAGENAVALSGEWISLGLVGEREGRARIIEESVTGLHDSIWLAKPVIERGARGRHVRVHAFEDDTVRLVLVEAAVDEVA